MYLEVNYYTKCYYNVDVLWTNTTTRWSCKYRNTKSGLCY